MSDDIRDIATDLLARVTARKLDATQQLATARATKAAAIAEIDRLTAEVHRLTQQEHDVERTLGLRPRRTPPVTPNGEPAPNENTASTRQKRAKRGTKAPPTEATPEGESA